MACGRTIRCGCGVTRNRIMAARALEDTPRAQWGSEVRDVLTRAAAEEPDEELRGQLHALLSRH